MAHFICFYLYSTNQVFISIVIIEIHSLFYSLLFYLLDHFFKIRFIFDLAIMDLILALVITIVMVIISFINFIDFIMIGYY
jgi:hypothetical protein